MTVIDEEDMDDFFDFEHAADPMPAQALGFIALEGGPYDLDVGFGDPNNHEDSLDYLQHSGAPGQDLVDVQLGVVEDTTMMGPSDFTDFPRWIEGMEEPCDPCDYCRRRRIHCKVMKEGLRIGSCTSCVALARSCSLTLRRNKPNTDEAQLCAPTFCLPDMINSEAYFPMEGDFPMEVIQDPLGPVGDWMMENGVDPNDKESFYAAKPGSASGSPLHNNSSSSLVSLSDRVSEENLNVAAGETAPKVGARFSRESIRILRNWLSTHHTHPYPNEEEKESLRRQTGLNKTQITNWLANARRRGKVRPPRSTSPSPRNHSNAMDIPKRAGTPALETMNPLERWKNSPPEHEAASVSAIRDNLAKASSSFSSGLESPYSYGHTDDGSNRSLCNVSSASSLATSHSSTNSFASAFSHKSRGSFGSFGSFGNRGRRRRRKAAPKPVKPSIAMNAPVRTFQCTFCTETFKTKHDWQRHEKSLHLSLERWVCCPDGHSQFCADYGHNRCVFCGLPNPTADHAEMHNYSSCCERSLEERTFYRKDHLRQHMNLVHDVKFQSFSMETWKVASPEIRSRCGFCGIIMDSWTARVDHVAEHFKSGKSMADWKGDWGFEPQVVDIVENGMPPYLIHDERNSPNPYEASKEAAEDEKTLEDMVKIGLAEYIHDRILQGTTPTDEDLLSEARKVITKADHLHLVTDEPEVSWFRDLLMLYGTTDDKMIDPSDRPSEPWAKKLERIASKRTHKNGLDLQTIACAKQRALMAFVESKQALGLQPRDRELQDECCRILDTVEDSANFRSKSAVGWFKWLITSDSCWLREFRRRANMPRSSDLVTETIRSMDDRTIDYSIHNQERLEAELKDWCRFQLALGDTPTDADIKRKARLIVFEKDDAWDQTAVDDPAILHLFKRQMGLAPEDTSGDDTMNFSTCHEDESLESPETCTLHWDLGNLGMGEGLVSATTPGYGAPRGPNSPMASAVAGVVTPNLDAPLYGLTMNQPSTNTNPTLPLKYFLQDANCYGRLVRELNRFVTACRSPNNPTSHIPTDAELQNHARWVIYDDDDPWNQTAADNAEWLTRFKRDIGLLSPSSGPGLPQTSDTWRQELGGSGFAPPYLCPVDTSKHPEYKEDVTVSHQGIKFDVKATTAQRFLKSMPKRYQRPASVFCSRDLETGLNEFTLGQLKTGNIPSDTELRFQARKILDTGGETAADEPELLAKFKLMHGISSSASSPSSSSSGVLPSSSDIEKGLNEYVFEQLTKAMRPSDEELKAQARKICGKEITEADDIGWLQGFKARHEFLGTTSPYNSETDVHLEPKSGSGSVPDSFHSTRSNSSLINALPALAESTNMFADFDHEIANMDLSGLEVPSCTLSAVASIPATCMKSPLPSCLTSFYSFEAQTSGNMDSNGAFTIDPLAGTGFNVDPLGELPQIGSSGMGVLGQRRLSRSKGDGLAPDYAEMFMVAGATASPLRRRASARRARDAGFAAPFATGRGIDGKEGEGSGMEVLAEGIGGDEEEEGCSGR